MSLPRVLSTAAAVLVVSLLAACGGGDSAQAGANNATKSAAPAATQVSAGERAYQQRCASCHLLNGQGTPGVFPPLDGSEYVTGNMAAPIRILLHGIQGPITVKGAEYNSMMPAYGISIAMSDEEAAAVLTYIRTSWGNTASVVTAADIAKEREATKGQTGAVTAAQLKPLMGK